MPSNLLLLSNQTSSTRLCTNQQIEFVESIDVGCTVFRWVCHTITKIVVYHRVIVWSSVGLYTTVCSMYGSLPPKEDAVGLVSTTQRKRRRFGRFVQRATRCLRQYKRLRHRLQNTTIHGLGHVVKAKSTLSRLFWVTVFVLTLGGCTFSVLDRVVTFAKRPTATTIAVDSSQHNVSFPAVTICNLNSVRLSYAVEHNLTLLLSYIQNPFVYNSTICNSLLDEVTFNKPLRDVYYEGRTLKDDFVLYCSFFGNELSLLNCKESLAVTLTDLGYCYTFNGLTNVSELSVPGAGARYGLHLLLNINQSEYLPSFGEAGVKVAIHPRGVPPQPYSKGIAVPAGRSGFISLRKITIEDNSIQSQCGEKDLPYFKNYNYSVSACELSNSYADVAEGCGCLDALYNSSSLQDTELPNCAIADICCAADQHIIGDPSSTCPVACSYTRYDASTTYSTFPSLNSATLISTIFNHTILNTTENLVSVSVYFEDLNTQTISTENSYTPTALLSDIGGQLGLFLGASIVSVIELCMYCFDETIDSCRGCSKKLSTGRKEEDDEDSVTGEEQVEAPDDTTAGDKEMTTTNI